MRPSTSVSVALLLALSSLAAFPPSVAAGTALRLQAGGTELVGKNEDGISPEGALIVNPRGLVRQAAQPGLGEPARWAARYGSVTFNRFAPGSPTGGMNEAGLVVESLPHDAARYPDPDGRPALGCLEWVQYQLDTAASVRDVIASGRGVRIECGVPLHFFIADPQGAVAAVEFLDGRGVVHSQASLPVPVLTEATYQAAVLHLAALDAADGAAGDGVDSLSRFARAARRLDVAPSPPASDPTTFLFGTLAAVTQGSFTQRSIVYDLGRREVHVRSRRWPEVRHLVLESLDFRCTPRSIGIDLDSAQSGPLADLLRPLPTQFERTAARASSAEIVAPDAGRMAELERRARTRAPARCHDR